MKILFTILAVGLVSQVAFAKDKRNVSSVLNSATRVSCNFTEPFFDIELNLKHKSAKVRSVGGELMDGKIQGVATTVEVEDLKITSEKGVWTVTYKGGDDALVPFLVVNANKKGSDGMSEKVYDAAGNTDLFGGHHSANNGSGGCNFFR